MHKLFFKLLCFGFLIELAQNTTKVVLTCGNNNVAIARGPTGPQGADGARGSPGAKGEPGGCDKCRDFLLKMQNKILKLESQLKAVQPTHCKSEAKNNTALMALNMQPTDCKGFNNETRSRIYNVIINQEITLVYCDQTTDGGGWMVIQRRINGSQDFYLNWENYVNGFGNVSGEYWLGLNYLHHLTKSQNFELKIVLVDWEDEIRFARYSNFKVGNPESFYQLTVEGYSGNAGDSMAWHNGSSFSTFDQDHDDWSDGNCANNRHGAWWYVSCANTNLNGNYLVGEVLNKRGIYWWFWKNNQYLLKRVKMMIRPL